MSNRQDAAQKKRSYRCCRLSGWRKPRPPRGGYAVLCPGQEIITFRGNCELSSRNVFLVANSSAVGWIFPVTSVTRDTSVCSPVVAPFQAYVNSFHEYLVLVPGSITAGCHGPSSTRTSTDFSGVPSFNTTPSTLCRLPSRVTRAMKDFNCMWVIAVSFHFISPPIISPFSVRYHRASYFPTLV